jgi:hypothetical protein
VCSSDLSTLIVKIDTRNGKEGRHEKRIDCLSFYTLTVGYSFRNNVADW